MFLASERARALGGQHQLIMVILSLFSRELKAQFAWANTAVRTHTSVALTSLTCNIVEHCVYLQFHCTLLTAYTIFCAYHTLHT